MTFGNYVLFNLLVAILVEGFSAERIEREQKEKEAEERAAKKAREVLQRVIAEGKRDSAASKLASSIDYEKAGSSSPACFDDESKMPAPIIITHTAATPEVRDFDS